METEVIHRNRVHQGRNIRRTRLEKNINQDVLSERVHMSQPTVSRYENSKVIETDILERFANALEVPVEYLETLEEDAQTVVFESNIVNNSNSDQGGQGSANSSIIAYAENQTDNRTAIANPLDKISELYERLLKEKDDKYAALEKRIHDLEQRLEEKQVK